MTAIQRLYDKGVQSQGTVHSDLIAGAKAFGARKASRISGLAAPDPRTLKITLVQPAADFLSMLTLHYFAPVPGEYAASYAPGTNYDGQARVAELRADPEGSKRLSVDPTSCLFFLALGTHREAGAIADVRVRRAVNYAVDKVAYRDAVAGNFAPAGELASTVLAPTSLGYHRYDLYPTPGGRGDLAKARALLAAAGYPHGLTLTFATFGSGRYAAAIWGQIDQRQGPAEAIRWA